MTPIRESLFDIIGKDRRRYHSAILTTFSFDPDFFEYRVMNHFRLCGIHNVNVLIDGYYYNTIIQETAGRIERTEVSYQYSIYPIFGKSIFHPKIWLLIGNNEGLLIIGSGNLTSAGHLSNDELWGAFHVNTNKLDNQALFASAWRYVKNYTDIAKGHFRTKTTDWIIDNALWIKDLPNDKPGEFSEMADGNRIVLLYNSPDKTIWQQIKEYINGRDISTITTLSPFYDKNGQTLQTLRTSYPNAQIHAVFDRWGQVPSEMSEDDNIFFYDWQNESAGITNNNKSRLHAKLIHWKSANGTEYCLFGSANVTMAGLGLPGSSYTNAEVVLLIEATEGNLLSKIGLSLNKQNALPLPPFSGTLTHNDEQFFISRSSLRVHLLSAEIENDTLKIYWEGDYKDVCKIQLLDNEDCLINTLSVALSPEKFTIDLTLIAKDINYVQVIDISTLQPVSNKLPVAYLNQLFKTHPDPTLVEFTSICEEIRMGNSGRLLDLLEYLIRNEEIDENLSGKPETGKTKHSSSGDRVLNDLTDYNFENQQALTVINDTTALDVLHLLRFAQSSNYLSVYYGNVQVEEQEVYLEDDKVDINSIQQLITNKSACLNETKQIVKYLKVFTDNLNQLILKQKLNEQVPINLTTLTKYLIALELLFEYGGKVAFYEDKGQNGSMIYLPFENEDNYEVKNVKGCCLLLIGSFLHLSRYSFKKYSIATKDNEVEKYKKEALVDTIICILNSKWQRNEQIYFKTLLLNTLHSLGWRTAKEHESGVQNLKTFLKERLDSLKKRQNCFQANEAFFLQEIIPAYLVSITKREKKEFETNAQLNQIIYTSYTGYCSILRKTSSQPIEYTLSKPGFPWNNKQQNFCFKDPIKLSSFVIVI
ncbi:hypothetical protein GVN20_06905 [Runella sp. CRIBMP]|uniref:hypothetical protein n=1 Tax=Runella sp. CRIBMP TaxID=2683261 RepID=UPI001412999C|nr:hypothetical protein [Runella sp. CRIBMP]NBB19077.1 hypothetical protein [Runella sp. CRIBMP]